MAFHHNFIFGLGSVHIYRNPMSERSVRYAHDHHIGALPVFRCEPHRPPLFVRTGHATLADQNCNINESPLFFPASG